MRLIFLILSFINEIHPFLSICRTFYQELINNRRMRCKYFKMMIGKVHVYRIDRHRSFHVNLKPFSLLSGLSGPPGFDLFIIGFVRFIAGKRRGSGNRFPERKQIPSHTQIGLIEVHLFVGYIERIIRPGCMGIHSVAGRDCYRKKSQSPFKRMTNGDCHRCYVPVVSILILKGMAMPCPTDKSARLKGEWIIFHIFKRSQRVISYINPVTIDAILSTRSCILQIITSFIFQHTRSFIPSLTRLFIILSGHFPSIFISVVFDQRSGFSNGTETVFRIYFHSHDRIFIRASPIHIHFSIIVSIESRIMKPVSQLRIYRFPRILFRMGILEYLSFTAGSGKVQRISDRKNGRSIILQSRYGSAGNVFPIR